MGLFSIIGASKAISKLQKGQSQQEMLSLSDLVVMFIDLNLAAARLNKEDYNKVYALYQRYKADTAKRPCNWDTYLSTVTSMMLKFDSIAPYDEYCATPEMAQTLYEAKERLATLKKSADQT